MFCTELACMTPSRMDALMSLIAPGLCGMTSVWLLSDAPTSRSVSKYWRGREEGRYCQHGKQS